MEERRMTVVVAVRQMTRVVIAAIVGLCDASLGQRNLSIFIEKRKSLRQSSAVYLRIEWESSSH